MNDRARIKSPTFSIAAVERDTGLSKDTLRVWERRYGFPSPGRGELDERAYSLDQVEKLRLIKRLLDGGHRPGRVVPLPFAALQQLCGVAGEPEPAQLPPRGGLAPSLPEELQPYVELIRQHDAHALRAALQRALARMGVGPFVMKVVGPLNGAVGEAWLRGQLEIFEEHLYTEVLQGVLRLATASLPEPAAASRPRVLLSTFPGEPHGLGLLMAEPLFALEGCSCLSLGTQTPLWDTMLAATAHGSDIVALSFTGCMNPNQIHDGLVELRQMLPPQIQVWAGGTAPVLHRRPVEGVLALGSLESIAAALGDWRQGAGRLLAAAGPV